MLKKLLIITTVFSLVCALFIQSPITQAAISFITNPVLATPMSQETGTIVAPVKRQIVPKIINGELDLESNITITGIEKQNFDNCKLAEKQYRSVRNKNKPTACFKQPKPVNDEFTDQVYTTLFDRIQDKKDIDDKKDMNVELKLNSFIDIKNVPICNETGFDDNVKTLSKLGLDNNVSIASCNSISSSSSISVSSSSMNSNNSSNLSTSSAIF